MLGFCVFACGACTVTFHRKCQVRELGVDFLLLVAMVLAVTVLSVLVLGVVFAGVGVCLGVFFMLAIVVLAAETEAVL